MKYITFSSNDWKSPFCPNLISLCLEVLFTVTQIILFRRRIICETHFNRSWRLTFCSIPLGFHFWNNEYMRLMEYTEHPNLAHIALCFHFLNFFLDFIGFISLKQLKQFLLQLSDVSGYILTSSGI